MKTTVENFVKQYHYKALAKAVIAQCGADYQNILESCRDARDGYTGFIYYNETIAFYNKHKKIILEEAKELMEDLGLTKSLVNHVMNYACLQGQVTEEEVAMTLYGTKKQVNDYVANALAWGALERVAYDYQNWQYEVEKR